MINLFYSLQEKRKRREENLKRREENERKAEIVQVVSDTVLHAPLKSWVYFPRVGVGGRLPSSTTTWLQRWLELVEKRLMYRVGLALAALPTYFYAFYTTVLMS